MKGRLSQVTFPTPAASLRQTRLFVDMNVRLVRGAASGVPAQELQILEHLLNCEGGKGSSDGPPTPPAAAPSLAYPPTRLTLLLLGVVVLLVDHDVLLYGVGQQLEGVHHLDVAALLAAYQRPDHWRKREPGASGGLRTPGFPPPPPPTYPPPSPAHLGRGGPPASASGSSGR